MIYRIGDIGIFHEIRDIRILKVHRRSMSVNSRTVCVNRRTMRVNNRTMSVNSRTMSVNSQTMSVNRQTMHSICEWRYLETKMKVSNIINYIIK